MFVAQGLSQVLGVVALSLEEDKANEQVKQQIIDYTLRYVQQRVTENKGWTMI